MLEMTHQMKFVPGSNLKGQVAGANWSFLLPEMRLERVVCFGIPSKRAMATLSLLSQEVTVVIHSPDKAPRPDFSLGPKITTIRWGQESCLPDALVGKTNSIDLLLISGSMIKMLSANSAIQRGLLTLLKPEGWMYLELNGLRERFSTGRSAFKLAQALGAPRVYWSTPLNGELHTAVPAGDQATIRYFIRHGLYQPEIKKRMLKHAVRLVSKRLVQSPFTRRHSILVSASTDLETQAPPKYLCAIAGQAGINIQQHRWGLVAHGEYSTRKVLFYLFKPDKPAVEYIVKMVRDPAFNLRLENEHRALATLTEKGAGGPGWFPRPAFFGYANQLAVLCEEALDGEDFRKKTSFRPDCTYARRAIQHLTLLGRDTLELQGIAPEAAQDGMLQLFNQFIEIYHPEQPVRVFLENQIHRIGVQAQHFPLVFQHGDPGIWNMLVTGDDQVVILDWEAAEMHGIPLWDLFYFLRSYVVGAARKAGIRDAVEGFKRFFFEEAEYSRFALEAVEQYRQSIGLPVSLVEPLFYTCWMHRSLKEANRLSPQKLHKGHYYNLLCKSIQHRNTSVLTHLFKNDQAIEVGM